MQKKLAKLKKIKEKVKEKPRFVAIPAAILAVLLTLGLIWEFSPLAAYASPDQIAKMVGEFADQPHAAFMMVGVIIAAQLLCMPLIVVTLATAMAFPPLEGILISLAGACTSAAITYGIGYTLGGHGLRRWLGPTLQKIRNQLMDTGIVGLIVLRFIPVAPYSVMNVALGVMAIPFVTFMTACFLELLPGCAIRAYLGGAISELWKKPDAHNFAVVGAGVAVWIAVVALTHWAGKKYKQKHARTRQHPVIA